MASGTGPIYTPSAAVAKGLSFTGYAVQDSVNVITYSEEFNTAKHVPYETQNEILALIQLVYGRGSTTLVHNSTGSTMSAGPITISGHYGIDGGSLNPIFNIIPSQAGLDPANGLLLSSLANNTSGTIVPVGTFTSALNTTGSNISAPIYIDIYGGLTLTDPSLDDENDQLVYSQIIGLVQTLAVSGVVSGFVMPPRYVIIQTTDDTGVF